MLKTTSRTLFVLLFYLLPLVLFAIPLTHVDFAEIGQRLYGVSEPLLMLAASLNIGVITLKSFQWHLLFGREHPIQYRRIFQIFTVWFMTEHLFPLKIGELVKIVLFSSRAGVRKSHVLALLVVDELQEAGAVALLVVANLLVNPFLTPRGKGWLFLGLVGAGYLAVRGAMYGLRREGAGPAAEPNWRGRLRRWLATWVGHLGVMRERKKFWGGLAYSVGLKGIEFLMLWAVQSAFHLRLPLNSILFVMLAIHLAILIPFAPGNFGPFELAASAAYRLLGLDWSLAFTVAFVFHLVQAIPMILLGTTMGLALNLHWRDLWKGPPASLP